MLVSILAFSSTRSSQAVTWSYVMCACIQFGWVGSPKMFSL